MIEADAASVVTSMVIAATALETVVSARFGACGMWPKTLSLKALRQSFT